MERVTACNGNANGELLNNGGLRWQFYGDLKVVWQARNCNGNVTANSLTMERLLAMAMLWLFGGGMAVWH